MAQIIVLIFGDMIPLGSVLLFHKYNFKKQTRLIEEQKNQRQAQHAESSSDNPEILVTTHLLCMSDSDISQSFNKDAIEKQSMTGGVPSV